MDLMSKRSSTASGRTQFKSAQKINTYSHRKYEEVLFDITESQTLYILFTATESPNSGYSWCPICTEVKQVLEKYLSELKESIFLCAHVGSQEEWDDESNPFRTDKELKLRVVPTVWKYRTNKRLEGLHCLKTELLDLVFEEQCELDD